MPQIVALEPALREPARRYVERREEALFFQSIGYVEFLAELLGARNETAVALRDDGEVCGVLPILAAEGRWGRVVNSLPFFGSHGGALADDEPTAALLVRHYNDLALHPLTAAGTLIESPLVPAAAGIAHNRKDSRIGQLTRIRCDGEPERHILGLCHYKTRNMIRKAQKSGIEVGVDNDQIGFLGATHRENLAALGGLPKPDAFFDLLPRRFAAGRDYKLYVARREGAPVAALLAFYFSRTAEYYMPVIRQECRELQPMSLLAYTAMCDAARAGYWWWNWGGTWHTQDGVYRFKSRWGSIDRHYAYYVQLNRPEIARQEKEAILDAYPYFYVLPFGLLEAQPA